MALTALTGLARHGKFLLNTHSHTILAGVGVAGTVTTAYLTGRATFKAAEIIEKKEKELVAKRIDEGVSEEKASEYKLTRFEKIKLVWRHYIPPGAVLVTTVTCIIVANKIASKKIAALAIASGISERALQEYKAKVVEKLGERQDTKLRDEIAQDRVNKNPPNSREIILAGTGEVLCMDLYSGRYFQSTIEEIKRAENKVNYSINNFMSASLSEFYEEIGLPPTSFSDQVGWNANHPVEIQISAVMSPDDRPVMAVDFVQAPTMEYQNLHD